MNFPEAVERVAEMAGVAMPARDEQAEEREKQRASLTDVMEMATSFFEERLHSADGAKARAYLRERGLSSATQQAFRLGYAPDSRTVVDALVQRGVPQTQAKETAREAAGSIGRATSILEDDSFRPMYESAVRALLSVRENADVYAAFQMIAGYKDSARRILEIYETLASRLMRAEHAAAEPDEDAVRALLQRGVRGDRLLSCTVEALKKLTSNVSYQSTMEMLFFDLVNRED